MYRFAISITADGRHKWVDTNDSHQRCGRIDLPKVLYDYCNKTIKPFRPKEDMVSIV